MSLEAIFLDVDGTLHYGDYIWERMHKLCGTWDNLGEKYLRMYRNKEIDYAEFARLDVAAWRGASEELFNHAIESMTLHSELDEFFETCKVNNISVYLISNGVAQLAKYIVDNYNLAGYFANEVIVKDKKLTGEISLDYGFEGKGDVVRSVLNIIGISKDNAAAVGDSINDLNMFAEVGLPIQLDVINRVLPGYTGYIAKNWQQIITKIFNDKFSK